MKSILLTQNKIIDILLIEAKKAYIKKEVPVGALIYCNKTEKILAKGHNLTIQNNDIFSHAEIICIKKISKKINDWRLSDYDIYTTLKPCGSCLSFIEASRIKNIYYLIDSVENNENYYLPKINLIKINGYDREKAILKNFFQDLR